MANHTQWSPYVHTERMFHRFVFTFQFPWKFSIRWWYHSIFLSFIKPHGSFTLFEMKRTCPQKQNPRKRPRVSALHEGTCETKKHVFLGASSWILPMLDFLVGKIRRWVGGANFTVRVWGGWLLDLFLQILLCTVYHHMVIGSVDIFQQPWDNGRFGIGRLS